VLGLGPTLFAVVGMGGAVGGIVAGAIAAWLSQRLGSGTCLAITLAGSALVSLVFAFTSHWPVVFVLMALSTLLGTLWNVITVSLRQTIIPEHLLGRVNSVYRFFAWGMIPIGAAVGGLLVVLVDLVASREWALRSVWLFEALVYALLWLVGRSRLTTARIESARAARGYGRGMSEFLRYEVDGLVGTITIDRPEKRNAMTYAMLGDFISLVREAGADPATSVLVITGVPGAFCAGTDLADLATIPGETRGLRGSSSDHDVWWPIVQCPKPTICAIDGPAVGMGAEFTSQCDLRIASTNARFAWNFVHRGLVPDTGAGTWLLPRIVGLQNALRLTYTGQMIDADEALRLGYVLDVVAPDDLPARVRALAEQVATGSPHSHRWVKQLTYQGLTASVDEHMERHTAAMSACFKSDDHREGVASFLERRPARFTGR
jgi:enoyl-CoA hydratase